MLIDLSRLRGNAVAVSAVVLALWALSYLVTPLTDASSPLVVRGSTMDISIVEGFGGRIAGALKEKRHAGGSFPTRVGVLLGPSILADGVDPVALTKEAGGATRWLSLHGLGLTMSNIDEFTRLLFLSGLDPDELVLALSPTMFCAEEDFPGEPTAFRFRFLGRAAATLDVSLLRALIEENAMVPLNRAFPNRTGINHRVRELVLGSRVALAERLGLAFDALFVPSNDPWSGSIRLKVLHASDGYLKKQMEDDRKKGLFDAANYSLESPSCERYVDIIKAARSRGEKVSIVIMPGPKLTRDLTPTIARRCITVPVERAFGASAPAVHDLESSMPDDGFFDYVHLNYEGRKGFTARLSAALNVAK